MKNLLILLSGIIFFSCSNQNKLSQPKYRLEDYQGNKILVGEITTEVLWKQNQDWKEDYDNFKPDLVVVGKFLIFPGRFILFVSWEPGALIRGKV
jgi:hypothetical protein